MVEFCVGLGENEEGEEGVRLEGENKEIGWFVLQGKIYGK